MKTILLSLLFCLALPTSIHAQTSAAMVYFVDKAGTALNDNAVVYLSEVANNPFVSGKVIDSHIAVRNATDKDLNIILTANVTELTSGSNLQVCFPSTCHIYTEIGQNTTEVGQLNKSDQPTSLATEFYLSGAEQCTVQIGIHTAKEAQGEWVPDSLLRSVTLVFNHATTGIKNAPYERHTATYTAYTLSGSLVARSVGSLPHLEKGIYIIKQENGNTANKTYKHLVK